MFTIAKQVFLTKKKVEDMIFTDVWTCSQMEDKRSQLIIGQSKLDTLVLKLE
jgi:hypothetical protein